MTDHKLRLKPGICEQLKAYLGESTDQGVAERLNISYMTVRKAKAASLDQNLPAPMLFVSAASTLTKSNY